MRSEQLRRGRRIKDRRDRINGRPLPSTPHSALRIPHSVPVIGLLGGVGAGKSLVAAQLAKFGCKVVDADRIGHELLTEPAIRTKVRRRFGDGVMDARGYVNRRRLAAEVFADHRKLTALERIVHPTLWRRVRKALGAARRNQAGRRQKMRPPAVVLDAALILEKGLDKLCDVMLYIDVPAKVRRLRAMRARGWSPSEVSRREACQVSLKTKRNRADYVIDNRTSPQHTLAQVRTFLLRVAK